MRFLVHGVIDVLGHFEVPFAAACEAVIVGLRHACQLLHVEQLVADPAQPFDDASIQVGVETLANAEEQLLLTELEFEKGTPVQLPRPGAGHVLPLAIPVARLRLPQQIHDPVRDGLDLDFGALALEELEHVEVPVSLGCLGKELAGHLDERFDAQAIDLDAFELRANIP